VQAEVAREGLESIYIYLSFQKRCRETLRETTRPKIQIVKVDSDH
jgi:broad specificity phosphatase PhoE